ncbi:MFS transporter [Crocosphaera subtropica]|nr:MFS transporter [Crocosphaera subtropica]
MSLNSRVTLQTNLSKLLILKGLSFAWFPIPTIMLFYGSHGLSIEQSIFLKTVLSLSIFLLEIPSGYIADQWGRKFCLVSGSGIWVISWLIYCTQETFSWFIVAEGLTGVAGSLISGADIALTYDTLLQLGRTQEYRQFEGKLVAIAGISEAICGLIGALVAQYNLVYPFYLQTVCLIFYCFLATQLIEPKDEALELSQDPQNLWSIVKNALIINASIRWFILLSGTFSVATFLMVWLSQTYLSNYNVPTAWFGVVWVGFHGGMSCASLSANNLEQTFGLKKSLVLLIILLASSYLFLGIIDQVWGILFVAVIYCVRGWITPILNEAINKLVPSVTRATVFSIKSFVFRLGFAIIGTASGWLADQQSLNLSLIIIGIIFLIFSLFCWQNLIKLKAI